MPSPARPWFVYLLRCKDGSLYCGITTDLTRRLSQHNRGRAGAKYTRARRPVALVYSRAFSNRAGAASYEYRLKQLDRSQKLELLAEARPEGSTGTKSLTF